MIKTKKKDSIASLDKKLWKVFSEYVRRRDADERGCVYCVTCSKYDHYKNMDAGHFISRRHASTKFDEQNVFPQCPGCNLYGAGKQYEFGLALDRMFGAGTADKILLKSKMLCKRDRYDFECLIEEYKKKIKEL